MSGEPNRYDITRGFRCVSIGEAREHLYKYREMLRSEKVIGVTRQHKPIFVLVDLEYFETLTEALQW